MHVADPLHHPMKRLTPRGSVAALVVAAALLGFGVPNSIQAHDGPARPDVAVDPAGNVFVSNAGGELWRMGAGSDRAEVLGRIDGRTADDPGPIGITTDTHGHVYAAVASEDATVNGIWRFDAVTGEAAHIAGSELIDGPSDVGVASDGTLFATDTAAGWIWELKPGEPAVVWSADPLLGAVDGTTPNAEVDMRGIAVAADAVYVGGHDGVVVITVPIEADGSAGAPAVYAQLPDLIGGISVDAAGELIAVHPQADRMSLVRPDGTLEVIAAGDDGLDEPSSVALLEDGHGTATAFVVNAAADPPTSASIGSSIGSSIVAIDYAVSDTTHGGPDGPSTEAATVTLEAGDLWFAPTEVTIASDVPTTLRLVGVGKVAHNLVVDELGLQLSVGPGTTAEVTVSDLPPGTYQFYCSVFGHRRAGMYGTLRIE